MNTVQIKQRIHNFIDHADERFLRLVYSMVESEKEQDLFSTSDDEMVIRTKLSMESIEKGDTRNIVEFKEEINSWKKNRSIQLK